jgi:hypothetical protein
MIVGGYTTKKAYVVLSRLSDSSISDPFSSLDGYNGFEITSLHDVHSVSS